MLLSSSQISTQNLDALAVALREILSFEKAYYNIYIYIYIYTHTITLNNSRTKQLKSLKLLVYVVQVLFMTYSKFGIFSIVCSVFIKVCKRAYNYKIYIYTSINKA